MASKESILVKILVTITVVACVAIGAAVFIIVTQQQRFLTNIYQKKAIALAQSIDAAITQKDLEEPAELQAKLFKFILLNPDILKVTLALEDHGNLTAIASTDTSVGGSSVNEQSPSVFAKKQILSIPTTFGSAPALVVIAPTHIVGQVVGVYEMYISMFDVTKTIQSQMFNIVIVSLVALILLIAVIAFFMISFIKRPIQTLIVGANAISEGNLDYQIASVSNDEIGQLADAFNHMNHQLKEARQTLEAKVEERTQELREKNSQIEKQMKENELRNTVVQKMNQVMVGRELKMVEMKKEIARLKGETTQSG